MANVKEEKTKLLAGAIDRASTACLAIGVFAPLAAAFYEVEPNHRPAGFFLVLGTLIWLVAAIALHMLARRTLSRLPQ
jgi:hypothetical protein